MAAQLCFTFINNNDYHDYANRIHSQRTLTAMKFSLWHCVCLCVPRSGPRQRLSEVPERGRLEGALHSRMSQHPCLSWWQCLVAMVTVELSCVTVVYVDTVCCDDVTAMLTLYIQWCLFNPATLVPSQSGRINQLAGLSNQSYIWVFSVKNLANTFV